MDRSLLLALNVVELRARVLQENRNCDETGSSLHSSWDLVSRQIDFLIATYFAFYQTVGIEPWPEMLPNLGWPGQVLYELFGRTALTWEAFRKLVERSRYNLPCRTSLNEGDVVLHSVQERLVYRAVVAMSGVTHVELHPLIPGGLGRKEADILATAVTGSSVYIEVAISPSQAEAEPSALADYRNNLLRMVALCEQQSLQLVVIWSDEVASPRALAERLNDVRARLGLPTRPPAPLAWYEEVG